jgi:hypothetical protein
MSNQRYAAFSYDTENVGDEIQSLAAMQFLPSTDAFINREWISQFQVEDSPGYSLIMNGWFCHLPENWPPPLQIRPLLISMHFTKQMSDSGIVPAEHLLSGDNLEFLRRNGPVGARDKVTLDLLIDAGIESYFSGCLTLTLQRKNNYRDENLIIINDVPEPVAEVISQTSHKRIEAVSQITTNRDKDERFALACDLLDAYSAASLVVTSRLHCALPCVALGTPIILISSAGETTRFSGLDKFMTNHSVDGFCEKYRSGGIDEFDYIADRHLSVREQLIRRVSNFIGQGCAYYSGKSYREIAGLQQPPTSEESLVAGIVDACYAQILGRSIDDAGGRYYRRIVKDMGVGRGLRFVIDDLLNSNEGRANVLRKLNLSM